jgi:uroporphyrinogen decarboxylase
MAWQRRFDFDLAVYTAPQTCVAEHFGAPTALGGDPYGRRVVTRPCIKSADQWLELRPDAGGLLGSLNEGLRQVAAALGGTAPLLQSVPSPLTTAWQLAGDALFDHARAAPQSVDAGLQSIAAATAAFVRGAVEAGASGIRLVVQLPGPAILPAEVQRRYGRRFDLMLLQASGADRQLHLLELDAAPAWLDACVDYPVRVVGWRGATNEGGAADAAARFPGIVAGGIEADMLRTGASPADCFNATVRALASLGRTRAMMSTGGSCRTDTDAGNVDALIAAVARPAAPNAEGNAR